MPIKVMLCCNDWRNGNDLGKANSIEIEDISMQGGSVTVNWENKRHPDANAASGDSTLRIGRLTVPCLGYKAWVGNWCWDCATVRGVFAAQILNYLIKRGWHCEEGPCEIYELINAGKQIDPKEFPRLLLGDEQRQTVGGGE